MVKFLCQNLCVKYRLFPVPIKMLGLALNGHGQEAKPKVLLRLNSRKFWYKILSCPYDNKKIKTIRVVSDSLDVNVDNLTFSYSKGDRVFRKGNFIILISQPLGWCGKSNQYAFLLIFDIEKLIC